MQTSIYLAQLIGPVALVAAAGLLLNPVAYRAMAEEFLRSPALIYLSGLLAMTAGVAIVLHHNVWIVGWPTIVTVLGWLAAIGGAARIAFPRQVKIMADAMLARPAAMKVGGGVWLGLGLVLCFFGYFRQFLAG